LAASMAQVTFLQENYLAFQSEALMLIHLFLLFFRLMILHSEYEISNYFG